MVSAPSLVVTSTKTKGWSACRVENGDGVRAGGSGRTWLVDLLLRLVVDDHRQNPTRLEMYRVKENGATLYISTTLIHLSLVSSLISDLRIAIKRPWKRCARWCIHEFLKAMELNFYTVDANFHNSSYSFGLVVVAIRLFHRVRHHKKEPDVYPYCDDKTKKAAIFIGESKRSRHRHDATLKRKIINHTPNQHSSSHTQKSKSVFFCL